MNNRKLPNLPGLVERTWWQGRSVEQQLRYYRVRFRHGLREFEISWDSPLCVGPLCTGQQFGDEAYTSRAWDKSAIKSSMSSIPTAIRIILS